MMLELSILALPRPTGARQRPLGPTAVGQEARAAEPLCAHGFGFRVTSLCV